jgi:hypothetical protein
MAGSAVVAAALTDHGARSFSLWIDGLDVLVEPGGTSGRRYGVNLESIRLTEGGPTTNGTLDFTVRDPDGDVRLVGDETVVFYDHVRGEPLFRGTVDVVSEAIPTGIDHAWSVRCTDLNALLDRVLVPPYTLPVASLQEVVLSILAYVPLRAFGSLSGDAAGVREGGSQAKPVGGAYPSQLTGTLSIGAISQMTARAALQLALGEWSASYGYLLPATFQVFVDQYGGVRLFDSFYAITPSDYRTTTVMVNAATVTEPGEVRPSKLEITRDNAQAYTSVYVVGGSAAGTGWVSAEQTGARREGVYNQPLSTDALRLQAYGTAWLTAFGVQTRGSFSLDARPSPFVVHPGDYIIVNGSVMTLAASTQGYVQDVSTRFDGGGTVRSVAVTFGSVAASLARTLR